MPAGRLTTVDQSPHKLDIIRDMLRGQSIPKMAEKFGIPKTTLYNYSKTRLREYRAGADPALQHEAKALKAQEVEAVRDCVMEDVHKARAIGWKLVDGMVASIPENGKLDCDPKAAAGLLREIRGNAELQARLEGRLQDSKTVQVNVVVLSGHAGHLAQPDNPPAPADDVLEAEWSEISPGS